MCHLKFLKKIPQSEFCVVISFLSSRVRQHQERIAM